MRYLNIVGLTYELIGDEAFVKEEKFRNYISNAASLVDGTIEISVENELKPIASFIPQDLTPLLDFEINDIYYREYYQNGYVIAQNIIDKNTIKIIVKKDRYIYSVDHVLSFIAFEKLLWLNQRYILHSSVIEINNKSIAFVGQSGVGKSTQARLWENYNNANILCGDRSAIYIEKDNTYVFGIPFDGTERIYSNKQSCFLGIVSLRKGNENKLRRLSVREAFSEIYPLIIANPWNKLFQENVIDFVFELVKRVPVYVLTCTISKEAVDLIRGELFDE